VLSHFASDIVSPTEMKISQQVTRIEYIETAGELGALFLESKLIKTKSPMYNKRLRNSRKLILLKKMKNAQGYDEVAREPFINGNELTDFTDVLGIYKSDRETKEFLYGLSKDFSLCPKLLSLEKSRNECFYYRLGYCQGACVNKEDSVRYNLRLITAFSTGATVSPWPFLGPIAIEETSLTGKKEYILVDNWRFIGEVKIDEEGNKKEDLSPSGFDVDTYKILRGFFRHKQKNAHIIRLNDLHIADATSEFLP